MSAQQPSLFDDGTPISERFQPPTYFETIKQEVEELKKSLRPIPINKYLDLNTNTSTVTSGEYTGDRITGDDNYLIALVEKNYNGTPTSLKAIPRGQRVSKVGASFTRFGDTLAVAELTENSGSLQRAYAVSDALIFLTLATLVKDVHERSKIDATGYANLTTVEFTSRDPERFREIMKKMGVIPGKKERDGIKSRKRGRSSKPDERIESKNKTDVGEIEPVIYVIDYSELCILLETLTWTSE